MSAKSCSFLGLENLYMIVALVCLEVPFGGGSCHVEMGRLVCVAGQLTGFCVMRSFAEENFRTNDNVCTEMTFGVGSCCVVTSRLVCVIGQFTGFSMIWVFTESFFPNRPFSCSYQFHLLKLSLGIYDIFCSCWRYLWTTTLEEFIIIIVIYFVIIIIINAIIILIFITIIIMIIVITIIIIIIGVTLSLFFSFYCSFSFLIHEYLIKLISIRYFINVKSACERLYLFHLYYNCDYCLGHLFQVISFILFYNFVLQKIM